MFKTLVAALAVLASVSMANTAESEFLCGTARPKRTKSYGSRYGSYGGYGGYGSYGRGLYGGSSYGKYGSGLSYGYGYKPAVVKKDYGLWAKHYRLEVETF